MIVWSFITVHLNHMFLLYGFCFGFLKYTHLLSFLYLFTSTLSLSLSICVYGIHICHIYGRCTWEQTIWAEDSLLESVLFLHGVGPGYQTQVTRLGNKCIYLLNQPWFCAFNSLVSTH